MTVAKLIKLLSKQDPKSLVVLSSDAEGNSFSPLAVATPLYYDADDNAVGEEDEVTNGKACVVLWP